MDYKEFLDRVPKDVNRILNYIDDEYENEYSVGISVLEAALVQYIIEKSDHQYVSRNLEVAIGTMKSLLSEIKEEKSDQFERCEYGKKRSIYGSNECGTKN